MIQVTYYFLVVLLLIRVELELQALAPQPNKPYDGAGTDAIAPVVDGGALVHYDCCAQVSQEGSR